MVRIVNITMLCAFYHDKTFGERTSCIRNPTKYDTSIVLLDKPKPGGMEVVTEVHGVVSVLSY